jgi:hypothetical protein
MVRWLACGVLAFAVAAGCSDPAPKPAPAVVTGMPPVTSGGGVEGGAGDGGAGDGGVDAGSCTDLPLTGTLVDRTGVLGDPPTSTGGTIVDGDYDLTVYSVFVGAGGVSGPTGITAKASIRLASGKIDEVLELGGTGKTVTTTATRSTFSASGATFAETQLCPMNGAGSQLQYTANDTILTLTDLSTKEAFTFTKR